jgi:hypothetical protein
MKTFFLILITSISLYSNAQTITPKPIYKGSYQRLEIEEMENGAIWFGFQNPDYTTIVDIVYFTCESKTKATELVDKAIFILAMEKTDKEQHIRDIFLGVDIVRYGFAQKQVYLGKGLILSLKECSNIKKALESYQYLNQLNK